jgi:enoyl-CoA hydratase/carnithine racemase
VSAAPKPQPRSFVYEEDGAVARIRLNRPEQLNALTFEVYRELTATFRALAARPGVRAISITGTGRAFCTGGDVRDIIGELLKYEDAQLLEFTRMTCDLVRAIRAVPRPVVASLNGTVAGAGAAIALASDFRVAADTAKIAFLFVKVGLAGADMGAAHLLPRLVGLGRATELLMLGEFVDAHEAHRIGLYNRVVPSDQLAQATDDVLQRLARGPRAGLAETKRALEREQHMDLATALEDEAHIQATLMRGPDFREGFQAFVEKRAPRFEGAPE